MDYFPVSLNIKKFRTPIVGEGKVTTQKATRLATYTEQVTVVAPHISEGIRNRLRALIEQGLLSLD